MSWLSRFQKKPAYEKISDLMTIYCKLKTRLVYKQVFKSMGSNCIIRKPLLLLNCVHASLGNNVLIREGVRIELVCGSSRRTPDLQIGDNVNIEQNVHIVCHSRVILGANVSVTANCAIVDVTHPFDGITENSKIADRILDEDSFVEIGEGAVLGFGCVVLPNVRIGRRAMIGANAVVTNDVPDYGVAAGVPAKLLRIYKPAD